MIPRHALARALRSRTWRRFSPQVASASTATAPLPSFGGYGAQTTSTNPTISTSDMDLKTIFDSPYSLTSPSFSHAPQTGLFGIPSLHSPDAFISLAHTTIIKARAIVSRISAAPSHGDTSQEMRLVVKNFDRLSDTLCAVIDVAELVRHAHSDPEWNDKANEAYEMLCSYMNELNTSTELYEVLHSAVNNSVLTSSFSSEEKAVAEIFLRDFEKSGIDLPPNKRSQFVNLSSQVISLGRSFLTNGAGSLGYVDISIAQLENCLGKDLNAQDRAGRERCLNLLESLRQKASRLSGKVRVHAETYEAHMLARLCGDESIRRDIYIASNKENKGNVKTLDELLKMRAKLANLVGKESYSEMTLGDKMAKSPENVAHFLRALNSHHRPGALEELDFLGQLKTTAHNIPVPSSSIPPISASPSLSLLNNPHIQPWDKDYLTAIVGSGPPSEKSQTPSPTRRNITIGTVFASLSQIYSSLFGLRLRVVNLAPGESWADGDVRKLEVYNEEKGETVGWIFADLWERDGKANGAAHYTVRCSRRVDWDDWAGDRPYLQGPDGEGLQGNIYEGGSATAAPVKVAGKQGTWQLPIAVLSCDFSRPSVSGGASMLSYNEVETLYHEMGHALHSMLGQTEYHNVSGTRCATDFVEFPSILMEHILSSSYTQSLILPPESRMNIVSARNRSRGQHSAPNTDAHFQILLSMLDQSYHSPLASSSKFSSTKVLEELKCSEEFGVMPFVKGTAPQMMFGHLYGYGATYYSYLFDQAIASRVYDKLLSGPLGNSPDGKLQTNPDAMRAAGDRYMNQVLRWGGGRDPWQMLGSLLEDEDIKDGGKHAMEIVGGWGVGKETRVREH